MGWCLGELCCSETKIRKHYTYHTFRHQGQNTKRTTRAGCEKQNSLLLLRERCITTGSALQLRRDLPEPCPAVQAGYAQQQTTRPLAHAPTMHGSTGIRTAVDAPVQTQRVRRTVQTPCIIATLVLVSRVQLPLPWWSCYVVVAAAFPSSSALFSLCWILFSLNYCARTKYDTSGKSGSY